MAIIGGIGGLVFTFGRVEITVRFVIIGGIILIRWLLVIVFFVFRNPVTNDLKVRLAYLCNDTVIDDTSALYELDKILRKALEWIAIMRTNFGDIMSVVLCKV